jgi:DNA-binding response OmpR family regulator
MNERAGLNSASLLPRAGVASVLIVDDDEDFRESLIDLIEHEGYTAIGVGNGGEALEYLMQVPLLPKLALIDLMMPVMDGWELSKEIRSAEKLAAMEIVIISARYTLLADVSEPEVAARRLSKPLDIPALLAIVHETCGAPD